VGLWIDSALTKPLVSSYAYPATSRSKKLKTPCFPGLTPVMKEAHAVAVMGGSVDIKMLDAPFD
jgi:hypothetical protein